MLPRLPFGEEFARTATLVRLDVASLPRRRSTNWSGLHLFGAWHRVTQIASWWASALREVVQKSARHKSIPLDLLEKSQMITHSHKTP